jgi:CRP-like cAMP-binding protein
MLKINKNPFELLRPQKLFTGVSDEIVQEITGVSKFIYFRKKEYILQYGGRGTHLVLLIAGKLQVVIPTEDGRDVGISYIEAGDYFGELSIIDDEPRSAAVVATADSLVALIPKDRALELFHHQPVIAANVLKRLCKMVRSSSHQRSTLGLAKAPNRIYSVLINTAKTQPGNLVSIENLPNQQSIAIMANVSRESVSRALNHLYATGVLEKDYKRLIIRDLETLKKLAQGDAEIIIKKTGPQINSAFATTKKVNT